MTNSNTSLGEFLDEVGKKNIAEGQIWMEEWENVFPEEHWKEIRSRAICTKLVKAFTLARARAFQGRMASISGNELYGSTSLAGHEFLDMIVLVATQFDIDVADIASVPITYSEAVAREFLNT